MSAADHVPIQFPTSAIPWPEPGVRRISVNSFGFGGTNSHVIIDDAHHYMQTNRLHGKHCTRPNTPSLAELKGVEENSSIILFIPTLRKSNSPLLLAWSANDEVSLLKMTEEYSKWLAKAEKQNSGNQIATSLAHTLLQRRSLLAWRSFAVSSPNQGTDQLLISRPRSVQPVSDLSLAFVFTGQGAQWCGMGRELLVHQVFRESVSDAMIYLKSLGCERDLQGKCSMHSTLQGYWTDFYLAAFTPQLVLEEELSEPSFAQPICTILQIALVELLASVNVRPSIVIGHSSGEIAAA